MRLLNAAAKPKARKKLPTYAIMGSVNEYDALYKAWLLEKK